MAVVCNKLINHEYSLLLTCLYRYSPEGSVYHSVSSQSVSQPVSKSVNQPERFSFLYGWTLTLVPPESGPSDTICIRPKASWEPSMTPVLLCVQVVVWCVAVGDLHAGRVPIPRHPGGGAVQAAEGGPSHGQTSQLHP